MGCASKPNNRNREAKAVGMAHKLCQFIVKNSRPPHYYTGTGKPTSKNERALYNFYRNMRNAYIGKGPMVPYPSVSKVASSYGLKELFNRKKGKLIGVFTTVKNKRDEEKAVRLAKKFCRFIVREDRLPTPDEKQKYNYLSNKDVRKKRKEVDKVYKNFGLSLLHKSELSRVEIKNIDVIDRICFFIKKNNRMPIGTRDTEAYLYRKLCGYRYSYQNEHEGAEWCGGGTMREVYTDRFEAHGMGYLLKGSTVRYSFHENEPILSVVGD